MFKQEMTPSRTAAVLLGLLLPAGVNGYAKTEFSYNGLAQTPQMGWGV
jgi:hypothetical protein